MKQKKSHPGRSQTQRSQIPPVHTQTTNKTKLSSQQAAERLAQIERRKARHHAFSLTLLVMLIMVLTIFAILFIMREAKPRPRFSFIQTGTLSETVVLPGLIARDERLITAPMSGLLKPLATDGSRVAKGQKLAMIIPEGKEDQLKELQKCEKDIIDLQNELMREGKGSSAKAIYDESAASIASVINLIRRDLILHDLSQMASYQATLSMILEQRTAKLLPIHFDDARLQALEQTKEALEQSLGLDAATLICDVPGLVSFKLDGLENELNNQMMLSLPADTIRSWLLESRSFLLQNKAEKDKPVLRIATGLYQSLAYFVPGNQTAVFPIGSVHTLIVTDDGQQIQDCHVVRSEKCDTETLVVFKTDHRLEWLSDHRVIQTELTLSQISGLKVPYTALMNHDVESSKAELMLVIRGVVRKSQVHVIDFDEESAIIEAIETEPYQPVITGILVTNPKSVEEGEFIGN